MVQPWPEVPCIGTTPPFSGLYLLWRLLDVCTVRINSPMSEHAIECHQDSTSGWRLLANSPSLQTVWTFPLYVLTEQTPENWNRFSSIAHLVSKMASNRDGMYLWMCLFGLSVLLIGVESRSIGAPSDACSNLTPQHGSHTSQPLSTSPYTITPSSGTYTPGVMMSGKLSSPVALYVTKE